MTGASQTRTPPISWRRDIEILRDLSLVVPRNHLAAAEAFWDKIAEASERDNPPLEQKILVARLAAEAMSATENLGALIWAIANRNRHDGVARAYLAYQNRDLWKPLRRLTSGTALTDLIALPERSVVEAVLTDEDLNLYDRSVANLEDVLRTAAANYLAQDGWLVKTYNKIKHGFVVLVRLDALIEGRKPPGEWQNTVNVLTGIDDLGNITYVPIERTVEQVQTMLDVVKMCGDCWAELACLVIWLWEREVPM
jgi:hypothetical protein